MLESQDDARDEEYVAWDNGRDEGYVAEEAEEREKVDVESGKENAAKEVEELVKDSPELKENDTTTTSINTSVSAFDESITTPKRAPSSSNSKFSPENVVRRKRRNRLLPLNDNADRGRGRRPWRIRQQRQMGGDVRTRGYKPRRTREGAARKVEIESCVDIEPREERCVEEEEVRSIFGDEISD